MSEIQHYFKLLFYLVHPGKEKRTAIERGGEKCVKGKASNERESRGGIRTRFTPVAGKKGKTTPWPKNPLSRKNVKVNLGVNMQNKTPMSLYVKLPPSILILFCRGGICSMRSPLPIDTPRETLAACCTIWPTQSNTSTASTLCTETSNQKTCW